MTVEELAAIEQRLLGERKPIDVGDKVVIESFTGVDYVPYAHGAITKRDGEAIWLDENPTRYWLVDAHRDDPLPQDDIRSLIAEIREQDAILREVLDALILKFPLGAKFSVAWASNLMRKLGKRFGVSVD